MVDMIASRQPVVDTIWGPKGSKAGSKVAELEYGWEVVVLSDCHPTAIIVSLLTIFGAPNQ